MKTLVWPQLFIVVAQTATPPPDGGSNFWAFAISIVVAVSGIITALIVTGRISRRVEHKVDNVSNVIGAPEETTGIIEETIMDLLLGVKDDVSKAVQEASKARLAAARAASAAVRADAKIAMHVGKPVPNGHPRRKK